VETVTEQMAAGTTGKKPFKKHLIVLSAPSGAGKTTIAHYLLARFPEKLRFSVSATTREMRQGEVNGEDYHFISREEFLQRIEAGALIEYEEIFGNFYGTLHSEVDEAIANGEFLIFDVDVKGALSLRRAYPEDSMLLFIAPPDMDVLEKRLRSRQTESNEQIEIRLKRAHMEMLEKDNFDEIIVNSDLNQSCSEAEKIVQACFGEI